MKLQFVPTIPQITASLPHVRYEIESLLLRLDHDPKNEALVESVYFRKMAHGRVLDTFFSKSTSERHTDDVLAEDFGFPSRKLYGATQKELRDRFNKDLFHLTYSRLERTPSTKPWPMESLLLPVIEVSKMFIDHVIGPMFIPVSEAERTNWRVLKASVAGGLQLQQTTSNVTEYQIASIEINRRS